MDKYLRKPSKRLTRHKSLLACYTWVTLFIGRVSKDNLQIEDCELDRNFYVDSKQKDSNAVRSQCGFHWKLWKKQF